MILHQVLQLNPDLDLRYTLALPAHYAAGRPMPLVLSLHYAWDGGAPPAFYGEGLLLDLVQPALAELGAVMVAPDCPAGNWAHARSETSVLALLDSIQSTYPVDRSRLLVTGYSLGGLGAWYLASRHPQRFSAAIPISGWPSSQAVAKMQVPVYIIHSRQDELIPIEQSERVVPLLRARGVPVEFVAVEGVAHFETGRFVEALRGAVAWVRKIWGESASTAADLARGG